MHMPDKIERLHMPRKIENTTLNYITLELFRVV